MTYSIQAVSIIYKKREKRYDVAVAWTLGEELLNWRATTDLLEHLPTPGDMQKIAAYGWSIPVKDACRRFPHLPEKYCED